MYDKPHRTAVYVEINLVYMRDFVGTIVLCIITPAVFKRFQTHLSKQQINSHTFIGAYKRI